MFESWAMAKKGTPRRRGLPAALVTLAAFALFAAGCGGGGGDSGSEAKSRKALEAGAAKTAAADSVRTSVLFEVEEDGVAQELGCLDLAVDTAKPERFDLSFFDLNCSGGAEARELIAVGRRAWASSSTEPGTWTAARIAPDLLREVGDEQTDLKKLIAAAEGIEAEPEGGAVEAGDGLFVDATRYTFEAPASAFPSSSDLGDLEVEFEATLDHHGYLRELVVHGDEDGTGATVTDKFDDIDQDLGIEPPSPTEVKGPTTTIASRADFEALFSLPGQ